MCKVHRRLARSSADLIVEAAFPSRRFTSNDFVLSGSHSVAILTGPNCSGKSTLLKQTALIVILAHMGWFVPGTARIRLVDKIFARVRARACQTAGPPPEAVLTE